MSCRIRDGAVAKVAADERRPWSAAVGEDVHMADLGARNTNESELARGLEPLTTCLQAASSAGFERGRHQQGRGSVGAAGSDRPWSLGSRWGQRPARFPSAMVNDEAEPAAQIPVTRASV
jgi:hypothetical protein